MPNMPKRPGDAVLSRDGTVKVNGAAVGFWWVDGNDLYHFDFARPKDPSWGVGVTGHAIRDQFKAKIPQYLAGIGKRPAQG